LHLPAYFWVRAIRWCHLNFSPGYPCCHSNEIWNKIDYNSVCVRDICKIFASGGGGLAMGHQMMPSEFFPKWPSLPWQQNLGHNWLELSLRKRHIKDLYVRWGVFECFILVWAVTCAIIRNRTYAPHKNLLLNIWKIVIIYQNKTFLHFLILL